MGLYWDDGKENWKLLFRVEGLGVTLHNSKYPKPSQPGTFQTMTNAEFSPTQLYGFPLHSRPCARRFVQTHALELRLRHVLFVELKHHYPKPQNRVEEYPWALFRAPGQDFYFFWDPGFCLGACPDPEGPSTQYLNTPSKPVLQILLPKTHKACTTITIT